MASDQNTSVTISLLADLRGLTQGMADSTKIVKDATLAMQNSFGGVGAAITNLKAPFLAISSILAGGSMFRGAVDAAKDLGIEVGVLAKKTGLTTQEASILKVALHSLGVDTDVYARAALGMTRQINSGAKGLESLGIHARDANGNLRPTGVLMQEAIDKLNGLKAGTDRNAAGLQVFGRGWMDIQGVLRLSSDEMTKAAHEAERLHLVVGPGGVAQAQAYARSIRDMEEVVTSLKVQIGQQLLPVLTQLSGQFTKSGGDIASSFGSVFLTLVDACDVLMTAFTELCAVVVTTGQVLTDSFVMIYKVVKSAYTKTFGETIAASKAGWAAIASDARSGAQAAMDVWADMERRMMARRRKVAPEPETPTDTGTGSYAGPAGRGESFDDSLGRAQIILAQLRVQQAELNQLAFPAIEAEKLKVELLQLQLALKKAIHNEESAEELAAIRAQIAAAPANAAKRVANWESKEVGALDADRRRGAEEADREAEKFYRDTMDHKAKKAADDRIHGLQAEAQTYIGMAARVGEVFAGIATGQLSIVGGLKQILSMMVQVIAQAMIVLQIKIAVAAATAADSAGMIPLMGPALGIAAAAAMFSALMAYVPSAATGWDRVPADGLAMIHQGERIVPRYDADRLDAMAASFEGGSRGRGDTFHVTIQALDGPDLERTLSRNPRALARSISRAVKARAS